MQEPTAATPAEVWGLLAERLPFGEDGAVDWSQRPFAKRWPLRRLGRAGLLDLASSLVLPSSRCHVVEAGAERVAEGTVATALDRFLREESAAHRWLIDRRGRWVMELSADRVFAFEYVDVRNTKLLKRLQGIEAEWSRGGEASQP